MHQKYAEIRSMLWYCKLVRFVGLSYTSQIIDCDMIRI